MKVSVQIVRDNYDILNNEAVKKKYPNLYKDVKEHDSEGWSSWYDLTEKAYEEYNKYLKDKDIGYVR